MHCRVCESPTSVLFESPSEIALLSSATPILGSTVVDLCRACGHAQTRPVVNLRSYYESEYQFRVNSEDEDDLYDRVGDKNVYRSDQQACLVESSIDLNRPMKVLDYGCGKARSLKLLAERHPLLEPYVFDVSETYREFWNNFVRPERQASTSIPCEWHDNMDLVLSLFALEHVEEPGAFVATLRQLLRPGGSVFVIIPNMLTNVSDLVVVDHVNHFSAASLSHLFGGEGFVDLHIDSESYRGAFVVRATRPTEHGLTSGDLSRGWPDTERVLGLGLYLQDTVKNIRAAENARRVTERCAIYGSGIYGLFIATMLPDRARTACFLDQNPWRQGLSLMGIPVIAPDRLPDEIRFIYVGLNPALARSVIDQVEVLHRVRRDFFYLS
jgi:2-polyprenyl-3-methyl-5-hydroxy-6-metoxy-1,4-benzoquinol methylase